MFVANLNGYAQSVNVKANKTQILIGERLEYDLSVDLPSAGYAVNFKLPDSIPHFDIIENKDFDTSNSSTGFTMHKKIVFTSFDSGAWHIPSFDLLLERNDHSNKLITDSISVMVGYSPADSTNQLRDIKPIMEVTFTDYTWIYITGAVIILLAVLIFLYWYFKKRERKVKPVFNSSLTAFDEAMKALQELKKYDLSDTKQVKEYYTGLSDIFKKYYSRIQQKDLMNKTTGDILIVMKEQKDNTDLLSAISNSLRCADAVKFAKYTAGITESEQSLLQIRSAIELIEKERTTHK